MELKSCTVLFITILACFVSETVHCYLEDSSLGYSNQTTSRSGNFFVSENNGTSNKETTEEQEVHDESSEEGNPIITTTSEDKNLFEGVPVGIKDTPDEQKIEMEGELAGGKGKTGSSDILDDRNMIVKVLKRKKRAMAQKKREFRWVNALVYFKFPEDRFNEAHDDPSDSRNLDEKDNAYKTNQIKAAMLEIERKTCLRFTDRRNGADQDGCSLLITPRNDGICGTTVVGRLVQTSLKHKCKEGTEGETRIMLDPKICKKGSIMHELLHACGFYHEHQRPDRDKYVRPKPTRAAEIARGKFDFDIKDESDVDTLKTKYDYFSIMHYLTYFDVLDKKWFLGSLRVNEGKEAKYGLDQPNGSREELSKIDIKAVNKYYGCVKCRNTVTTADCKRMHRRDGEDFCHDPHRNPECNGYCKFKCVDPERFQRA